MSRFELCFRSDLAASAERVWRHASSPEGINRELAPLLRMTFPRRIRALSPESVPIGKPICRSWILLGRVLPIDRSAVTLVAIEPGRRFLERSPGFSQRSWQHERIVEPLSEGCRVTDELAFEPKRAPRLVAWFVGRLFRHRHRVLRRLFGSLAPERER